MPETSDYEVWVASQKQEAILATVELRFISIKTGEDIKDRVVKKDISLVPNGTTDVLSGTIDNRHEEPHVLAVRIWIDGEIASRDVDWPQPLKYLDFEDRGLEVIPHGGSITVRARKPTKGLVFEERPGVLVHDSAIDVVPGDEQVIRVRGLGERDQALKWTYLGRD